MTIYFIIGDGQSITPTHNTNILDTGITTEFELYKNGHGFLFKGVHYTVDYKGKVTLLNSAVFSTGEQYKLSY